MEISKQVKVQLDQQVKDQVGHQVKGQPEDLTTNMVLRQNSQFPTT